MKSTQEKAVNLLEFFDLLRLENEKHLDLIFDFVATHKLEEKFYEFLIKSFNEDKYLPLDLEFMALDYK